MRGISGILPPSMGLVTGGQASCYIAANLCFMVNSVGTTAFKTGGKVEKSEMEVGSTHKCAVFSAGIS